MSDNFLPGGLRPVPELLGTTLADASSCTRTSAYQRFFDPHEAPPTGTVQRPEDKALDAKEAIDGWERGPNDDVPIEDNIKYDPYKYEMPLRSKGKVFDPDVVMDAQVPPDDMKADADLLQASISACGQIAGDMLQLVNSGNARLEKDFDAYVTNTALHHEDSASLSGTNQFDHPDCKPLQLLDYALQMTGGSAISMDYQTWFAISHNPNTIQGLGYRPEINEMKFDEFERRMAERGVMKVVVSNFAHVVAGRREFVMTPHLHIGSPASKMVQVRFEGGGKGYRINHQSAIRLCRRPARRPNSVTVPYRAIFAELDGRLGRPLLPDGYGWQINRNYISTKENYMFSLSCRETIVPGPRSASFTFTNTISDSFSQRMLAGLDLGA